MTNPINEWIGNAVKTNDVVLFMKGTPDQPQCGFSGRVVKMLDFLGVPYAGVNVLQSDDLRDGIKEFSDWPTIPQLYVKAEMFQNGELKDTFASGGIEVKEANATA